MFIKKKLADTKVFVIWQNGQVLKVKDIISKEVKIQKLVHTVDKTYSDELCFIVKGNKHSFFNEHAVAPFSLVS